MQLTASNNGRAVWPVACLLACAACAGDGTPADSVPGLQASSTAGTGASAGAQAIQSPAGGSLANAGATATGGAPAGGIGAAAGAMAAGGTAATAGVPATAGAGAAGVGGVGGAPAAGTAAAAGAAAPTAGMAAPVAGTVSMDPLGPLGPEDGDPGGAVVAIPDVPCGENPSLFGLTTQNVQIGGRGVHLAYPCNKRAGAPVLFVLNLHGTMPTEDLKGYQVAYFSINNYVNSHNLITAAPKSVVSQWGNGDGGVDLPHIMEVIDYVYTKFADFDIRGMWVAGHSWGAMYSTSFVCDPAIADKVVGAMLQSGSGINPACADRISVISSAAENDIGPVINQGAIPGLHGCGSPQMNMVGNNQETYWPDCNPGFTHANYFMLGKQHADYMDAEVVERIADLMKAARP